MTVRRGVKFLLPIILDATCPIVVAPEPPPLALRYASATFRPGAPMLEAPGWYRDASERESPQGRRYLVAITSVSLDPDRLRLMEAAGATILGYIPTHVYRLRIEPARVDSFHALPFVA